MTISARRTTPPRTADRTPSAAAARTARTGTLRTGTLRTGALRTGTLRTGTLRSTPVRPQLWVVPDGEPTRRPRPGERRRAPFVLLVVALLVGTSLGLLILNTAIAVDSLKATQLRTENAQRAQEIQQVEQQVINGGTPEELAREAAAAGMVPAGPPAYLVIRPDGSSTVRGTPEPAPVPAPSSSSAPPTQAAPSSSSAPPTQAAPPSPTAPAGAVPDAAGD